MFTGFKNKIKEETGHDIDKFPPVINSSQSKIGVRGQRSNHGSTASLGSFSIDGTKDDSALNNSLDIKLADGKVLTTKEFKRLESKEDEWRKKLQKKEEECNRQYKKAEEEWKKQLAEKEKEWKLSLIKKDKEKLVIEDEKLQLLAENQKLKDSLSIAEDYKRKVCQYQEDIDQLEGFQTQEMAKVKHLLLVKEQELIEKEKSIKEINSQLDTLKAEVIRLRKFEQQFEDAQDNVESLRHNFDQEKSQLSSKLAQSEEEVRHLKDRVAVLEERTKSEFIALGAELNPDERVQALLGERALLERRLEESHLHLSEIKSTWSSKITSLETQVGRLCRQASEESAERRRVETEKDSLNNKIIEVEEELEKLKGKLSAQDSKLERLKTERDEFADSLKSLKTKYEEEIQELNKLIESTNQEQSGLEEKLHEKDKEIELQTKSYNELKSVLEDERNKNRSLELEVERLKEEWERSRTSLNDVHSCLAKEKREKDDMMMRNAQISQEVELARQELREQNLETSELHSRVASLEKKVSDKDKDLDRVNNDKMELCNKLQELERLEKEKEFSSSVEEELRTSVSQLENQLMDKNKSIKILQQRLADMKRTLQRELKVPTTIDPGGTGVNPGHDDFISSYSPSTSSGSSTAAIITPSSSQQLHHSSSGLYVDDDVNFKYLKHVLMKFLTSREYEAQHLTRAVATLLRFSAEEERLLKETLEWKMSWFGTRPNLGNGQTAKTIPPS